MILFFPVGFQIPSIQTLRTRLGTKSRHAILNIKIAMKSQRMQAGNIHKIGNLLFTCGQATNNNEHRINNFTPLFAHP